MAPLLTLEVHNQLVAAQRSGFASLECSLDLDRTRAVVKLDDVGFSLNDVSYPFLLKCKERTIYYWSDDGFLSASRYSDSLVKLVPTQWGAPTFEIDGIKMLPTLSLSPYVDARNKVALIEPKGKVIFDTCGGLGYFAAWCLEEGAQRVLSFEKNPDVRWLREINPWSPQACDRLCLTEGDISECIVTIPDGSIDAVLHDPPRFGIAGELYSQTFYDHLSRVLKSRGRMFHYTGTPNKLTSGRNVPQEVLKRLVRAGFRADLHGDGVLAVKR